MLKEASLHCYISSVFLSSRDDADDGGPEIGLEQKDAAHIVFMEGRPETCLIMHTDGTAVSLRLNLCMKGWIVMHVPFLAFSIVCVGAHNRHQATLHSRTNHSVVH